MDPAYPSNAIDCDVHVVVPSVDTLMSYLPDYWQTYINETAFSGPPDSSYPRGVTIGGNTNGVGGEMMTDLERLQKEVFGDTDVSTAILTCAYSIESIRNPFAAAALASAVNDWQLEHWLKRDDRLRGSIVVPIQDPDLASAEIDRVGHLAEFVQISLPVHSEALYGSRRFYPVYEAAVRHDLVLGIQLGGNPGNPPSAVGWPSHYIEEYVGMSHIFQSQLISIITSGVFDRFPSLRVSLLESGVTWLPSLMWRLDKEWKGIRREVPWVRRLPSDYIKEHVRLTMWPFDAPPEAAPIRQIIDQLGSSDLLLFASDFPHQYERQNAESFWADLPEDQVRKIKVENPSSFYRL